MKREILFRAESLADKKIVQGGYLEHTDEDGINYCIYAKVGGAINIDRKTLSQYTGFKDVKKQMIFENDFVRCGVDIMKVVFTDGAFYLNNKGLNFRLSRAMIVSENLVIIR